MIVGVPGPDVFDRVTVLFETGLLLASTKVTVIVEIVEPSAATDVGLADTVEIDALTAPAVKVTFVGYPIAVPLIVPVIFAIPAVVEEVRIAV